MQGRPSGALRYGRPSRRAVGLGCACVATVATAHHFQPAKASSTKQAPFRLQLPRPAIDAIAGAVGEFGQILLLYPVETVKVRCQTECISARQVMAELAKQAAKPGGVATVLKALYSGIGASAVLSMAVGAVHWLSFCAAKRAALDMLTPSTHPVEGSLVTGRTAQGSGLTTSSSSTSSSGGSISQQGGSQHHHHIHISSLHHAHDENVDTDSVMAGAEASQVAAAAAAAAATDGEGQQQSGQRKAKQKKSEGAVPVEVVIEATALTAGAVAAKQAAEDAHKSQDSEELSRRMQANVIGAAFGALATALIESPVELFRHQAQAGLISGSLVKEMGAAVRRHGPGALWFGFLPFLLEAFPYDVSELATYSQLRDLHTEALKPTSRFNGLVSRLPTDVWDAAMGAAAGVAAVMISMPLDVVKTYVQTHASSHAAAGPLSQVALFFRTGRRMVRQRGLAALFVGMVPRLLQQVPSSTICWYSVEACQKALEPFAAPGSAPAGGGH